MGSAISVAQAQPLGLRGGLDADAALQPAAAVEASGPFGSEFDDQESTSEAAQPDRAIARTSEDVVPLAQAGRTRAVQPFSVRVLAVTRRTSAGDSGPIGDEVFDGETVRDRPQGIRVGTFLLYPELYTGIGWSDNVDNETGGRSGPLYRINPSLRGQSDWLRHSLTFSLSGTYTGYPDQPDDDNPTGSASVDLALDVADGTVFGIGGRYSLTMEDASSAESGGTDQDVHSLGGSLSLRRSLGLVGVELRGDVDHTSYTNSTGETTDATSDRNNTVLSASLRLDGLAGAMISPFAEATALSRIYDTTCADPFNCEDRNATGYALRAGLVYDGGSKLRGEISIGWRSEDLEDGSLPNLEGLLLDGSLIWSPTRLTTVTGTLSTSFDASTIPGASGSILYSGDVRVAHAFSDALVGEIGVGYSERRYQGISLEERQTIATAGVTWAVTDHVALLTNYTYTRFTNSDPGGDYDSNTIEAGVRIRR